MNSNAWRSVVEAWNDACRIHSAKPAIIDGEERWSYTVLRERAGAWAAQLAALPEARRNIAVHLPHGAEMVAATLGVLAAGHAFVALDPSHPVAHRVEQLNFTGASAVLTREEGAKALRDAGWSGEFIFPPAAESAPDSKPEPGMEPASRACIYFTSGSSGKPKAVAWSHRTLAYAAANLQAMFHLTPEDRHALLTPLAVAATAAQIFATLAAGATLVIFEARRYNSEELSLWLARAKITTLQTVPALLRSLSQFAAGNHYLWPTLRAVKVGGEGCTSEDARLFATCAPLGSVLINGLGLTEAGFNVCWFQWKPWSKLESRFLPIGTPPPELELVLENADGTPVAPGETGEIVVRSPALADGYWNDVELTAKTWREIPGRAGWRELRTGDAGCWQVCGLLEHRGRLDDRVKIRGHRVDPAEVESILAGIEYVAASVVLPERDGEETRLRAFVQLKPGVRQHVTELRKEATARMPDYMVPPHIHLLNELPRAGNGKIDRGELAGITSTPESPDDMDPRDALEKTLHGLFSRVLRVKKFGINSSFFDLGGDSLRAALLFTGISKVLHIELPLSELSLHPTIESLAARIRTMGWNLSDNPVTLLTPDPAPEAMNLFAWPGAGSDVMAFADLARHLGSGIALYAIQHRGADGRRIYDLSINDITARAVSLIRRVQPHGPYALCGGSFGGKVALETARRLRNEGEEVRFLAMLDTYAPGHPEPRDDLSLLRKLELWIRRLRPLGQQDEPGLAVLRRGLHEKKMRCIARRNIRNPDSQAPILPMHERFYYLQEACFAATRDYEQEPYDGEVHFYRVEIPPPAHLYKQDETHGWHKWFTGKLNLDTVPGQHGWHFREPHVRTLAAKLRSALEKAMQIPGAAEKMNGNAWDAEALWDELAPWWDGKIGDTGSELFRDVALDAMTATVAVRQGERALDIACGNGWFSRRLARAGAKVTAVDISNGMLEQARARSAGLDIEYRRLDATRAEEFTALGKRTFDLAVCNMALQDLSSTEAFFPGVFDLVRPGGRLILSFVHHANPARAGSPPNLPNLQMTLPDQPRPHIEIVRPLPEVLEAAGAAGWETGPVLELPSASHPILAIVSLHRPETSS